MDEERISVVEGDITLAEVDAIVNAANNRLRGGGGVDGAIHRAAGPELLVACRAIGSCPTGKARITPGYRLFAPWVIHTVGPVWQGGEQQEDAALASCYQEVFALLKAHGLKTVAFPAISTGAYGFPAKRAAGIAVSETEAFLKKNAQLREVRFVCFDRHSVAAYQEARPSISVKSGLC